MPARPLLAASAAALLCVLLGLTLGLPATGATPGSGPGTAGDDHRSPTGAAAAQDALARAQALFEGRPADGREATLALRDLALQRSSLRGAERRAAGALLARPTDGSSDPDGYADSTNPRRSCGARVCIHWVESSVDRVPSRNRNGNRFPDYVDRVRATLNAVHASYVDAGYRAPKPDNGRGGNDKTDVYLADIGSDGLYGYCTTDQRRIGPPWDVWAYCVMDNDYDPAQFPTNTPTENMRVTAAHEYFHAVQYAYDFGEDAWFMEATATWAEDELFDGVDDNVHYLDEGQLGHPARPLDGSSGHEVYGNWIFFRYLTETHPTSRAGLPTLVRSMWRHADGRAGSPDQYSLQAVSTALAERGDSLGEVYAAFADANRRPAQSYAEGAANRYPTPPLWRDLTLSASSPDSGWREVTLDHLTSATARFRPAAGLGDARLAVDVDMAPTTRGSRAVVAVRRDDGSTGVQPLALDEQGVGSTTVPFSPATVAHVEVTLVNASDQFDCWELTGFSCMGTPLDDNRVQSVRAAVVAR